MADSKDNPGAKRQPMPAVFMFQPTEYEIVPNERLAEWEENMRKYAGIKPETAALKDKHGNPVPSIASISFCPGSDDCDRVGN